MNWRLWWYCWSRHAGSGAASVGVLAVFHFLFVWMTSLVDLGYLGVFLRLGIRLPLQGILPIPLELVATPQGMISLTWMDAVVVLVVSAWAVARGSDVVSGPLDRGSWSG